MSFPSERALHFTLADLLRRIPNITNVQILQGAMEFGKDIVFDSTGALGEVTHCAVIVKNAPISGTVGKSGSARTVLDQVEQALDTAYLDQAGRSVRPSRAFVISPFTMSQQALASIQGRLALRVGQVEFFCGPRLVDLFQAHWPSYLRDESLTFLSERLQQASNHSRAMTSLLSSIDLEPTNDSPLGIYVAAGIHKVVHKPEIDDTRRSSDPAPRMSDLVLDFLERRLPTPRSFSYKLRLTEFAAVGNGAQRVLQIVKGLAFCSYGDPEAEVREVRDRLEAYREAFEKLVLRGFAKSDHVPTSWSLGRIPKDALIVLPKTHPFLDESLGAVRASLAPFVRQLALDLLTSRRYYAALEAQTELSLADPQVLAGERLYAVHQALHVPFLRFTETKTFELSPNILNETQASLLIVGPPGSGKTSYCRSQALADVRAYVEGSSARVPAYVPLHAVTLPPRGVGWELLGPLVHRSALMPGLANDGTPTRVYLDGLDEVTNAKLRERIVLAARHAVEDQHVPVQFVITCRDSLLVPALTWLPRLTLAPLSDGQLKQLTFEWFTRFHQSPDLFQKQLDEPNNADIRDVIRVPLLATVAIVVFLRHHILPKNRSELYNHFTGMLCGGWDLAKGVMRPRHWGQQPKLIVLTSLAYYLHSKRRRECSLSIVTQHVRQLINLNNEDAVSFVRELLTDGILVKSGTTFFFAHLSFQEFLAAKHLASDPSGTGATKALKKLSGGEDWWREVLVFYMGLSQSPSQINQWLNQQARGQFQDGGLKQRLMEMFPGARLSAWTVGVLDDDSLADRGGGLD